MTSPHQDAADLVAEVRWEAAHPMIDKDNWPSCALNAAANLIEQQAKALGDVQADADCQRYMANKNYDLWHKERDRTDALEARLAEAVKVIEPFANLAARYDDMVSDGWMPWIEFISEEAWPTEDECRAARSFLNSASNKEPK